MNVAITRSRSSLFIVGNSATLERSDETWKGIIEDARLRSCHVDVVRNFEDQAGRQKLKTGPNQPDLSYFSAPIAAKAPPSRPPISKPNSSDVSATPNLPGTPLLTPKQMKSSLSLNKSRQFSNGTHATDSNGTVMLGNHIVSKRKDEEDHVQQPSPVIRTANGASVPLPRPASSSPSTSLQAGPSRPTGLPPKPTQDSLTDVEKRKRNEADIRTLNKRRRMANNNPFIKK